MKQPHRTAQRHSNWRPKGPPATHGEKEALDRIRALLNQYGGIGWPNASIIDPGSGTVYEIDLVVLSPRGLFLLELKGWAGRVDARGARWMQRRPNGSVYTGSAPLLLTDRKAKVLKGLLSRRSRLPHDALPFVVPAVVMHGRGSVIERGGAAGGVYGLDGFDVSGVPKVSTLLSGVAGQGGYVDDATLNLVAAYLDEVLGDTQASFHVGDYSIGDGQLVDDSGDWQDYVVAHPTVRGHSRRIRIYRLPAGAGKGDRQRIARAARREYLLTTRLDHPGVEVAVDVIAEPPAVVFPHDPAALRLDDWLTLHAAELTLDQRLGLVRQLGETIKYAHAQGVHHRALAPAAVNMGTGRREAGAADTPAQMRIRDWQAGTQADPGTQTDTALLYPAPLGGFLGGGPGNYSAPEVLRDRFADPQALDVYGLGALAYLIVTGCEPPDQESLDTVAGVTEPFEPHGLDASLVADGLPDALVELIARATHPSVVDRTTTAADFLAGLSDVARDLAADEPEQVVDPLAAEPGELLTDDAGVEWLIEDRLGTGSTGVALLISTATPGERSVVLKVANNEQRCARRLADEAQVLGTLDHPLIVKLRRGPFQIGARTALLIDHAGPVTLREEIAAHGRLTWERLESFGNDLLEIADYLARQQVFHRDIKPDNLGIRPDRSSHRPRLALFDFSLSQHRSDDRRSGTPPYLDPFIGPRFARPAYDSAAERFAVAATLFVMATGAEPAWGDGISAPEAITDEVTVDSAMFEGPSAAKMRDFFARALARDAASRYDDIPDMARAWRRLFRTGTTTIHGTNVDDADRDEAAARATAATALTDAGLSAYAVSAAHRLGCETVGQLLALNPVTINNARGIGDATRKELQARLRQWRPRVSTDTTVDDDVDAQPGRAIEDVAQRLIPRRNATNADAARIATQLVEAGRWISPERLAREVGIEDTAVVERAGSQLRATWGRREVLHVVAAEIQAFLVASSGVATLAEIAAHLVARHGSRLPEPGARLHSAVPVIRAVFEAQTELLSGMVLVPSAHPDRPVLLALADDGGADPAPLLAAIRDLAELVDDATEEEPLRSVADSEALVTAEADTFALPVGRIQRLAALCSADTDVSTRGELYRRGLQAQATVARVLHGAGAAVAPKTIRERVIRRFPFAAPLPDRPELDDLVAAASPGLRWDGTNYARTDTTLLPSGTRAETRHLPGGDTSVEETVPRLWRSLETRSTLVLTAAPRNVDAAAASLSRDFDMQVVNVTERLLHAARAKAPQLRISWEKLVDADRAESESDRQRLDQFMALALADFWPGIVEDPRPLLLTDTAVLARYGLTDRLAELTDLVRPNPAARWILLPQRAAAPVPTLDGAPMPLGADGWLPVPAAGEMRG